MNAKCLASSSSGNCYIIELETAGNPVQFMIEAGLPIKSIQEKMFENSLSLSDIKFCLVTHGHKDHCLAIEDIAKRGINVFATYPTLEKANIKTAFTKITRLYENKPFYAAYDVLVTPFDVHHDIDGSLGFIIESSKEKILFVNDCKYFSYDLSNYAFDYIFIECNYNHKQVYAQYAIAKEKQDHIKIFQYERLLNSHMSLNSCIKHLIKLNLTKCKGIFLMHLSDGNANEYLMKQEVSKETGIKTFVCGKNGGIK